MLKVGDRVRLSAQGVQGWDPNHQNLLGNLVSVEGVVRELRANNMPYLVDWPRYHAIYREGDLKLVSMESTIEAWLEKNP